jgi:tetratricopeptide (TPR) repeat protein
LIGSESEAGDVEDGVERFDAVVAAAALEQARSDPELSRRLGDYVERQARLVDLQIKHFDEERRLGIGAAKRKRYADRIRNAIASAGLVVIVVSLIGLGWLVIDAACSRQVVVAPFDVAPGLAARDISGKIVAAGVLDELTRIQAVTRSSTQRARLSSAWEGNIRIEVPETGLSIGELAQTLRERFGSDVRIEGALLETPPHGLVLTVRGTGLVPRSFTGSTADLEKLTREAAECAFGQSRPALWTSYLAGNGRYAEAIAFARSAASRTGPVDRARILDMWSNAVLFAGGTTQEALLLARAAVDSNPEDWGARADVQNWLLASGDEERAWRSGQEMLHLAGGRPGRAPEIAYNYVDLVSWNLPPALAAIVADMAGTAGAGTNFGPQWAFVPVFKAQLHDPDGAELALDTAYYDGADEANQLAGRWAAAMIADERGQVTIAAQERRKATASANTLLFSTYPALTCFAAAAFERAGLSAEADHALAAAGSANFVDCLRFRADILDARGDWLGAQKAYAQAVALAPDLPAPYYSWGMALNRHADPVGAASKLRDANQRGPHWADPLKAWGDVLTKQGKPKEALAKDDEALKYAFKWKQLKDAHEAIAQTKDS